MAKRATWKGEYRETYANVPDEEGREVPTLVERVPVEHIGGIPARDLEEEEWQALTNEQRAAVRASSLYDVKTDAAMRGKDGE